MEHVDFKSWKVAMNSKMEIVNSNKVLDLVDALNRIKPIKYKCIYKRKIGGR